MQNFNCPRCNFLVPYGTQFCTNCGSNINSPPPPPIPFQPIPVFVPQDDRKDLKQGINFLVIALGARYLVSLFIKLIPILGSMIEFRPSRSMMRMLSSGGSFSLLVLLLVFAIITRNERARIFMWVFFGIEILFFIYSIAGPKFDSYTFRF